MLSLAGSQFPGLLFVKTLFLVVSGRVFTFREVKRATFVPTRGHTTVAKQADGASTPTQCFFPAYVFVVPGGRVALGLQEIVL